MSYVSHETTTGGEDPVLNLWEVWEYLFIAITSWSTVARSCGTH